MYKDMIVEEVRKYRQEWAARFGYNIEAMAADLRKREGKDGHRVVDLSQKSKPAKRRASSKEAIAAQGFNVIQAMMSPILALGEWL